MMDIEARKALKEKIKTLITKLETEVIRLEEATKPIGPENAIGRVSRMDAINNKSVSEAALRSSKRKLSSLRVALTKIDAPEFGICTRCKRPIAPARLMFMPESIRCINCADR
jgi:DnaK suppressor protein